MKLIQPYFEIWDQKDSFDDIIKHIEKVARVCYKSEDKITDNSAFKLVNNLIERKHFAMLEHGTIYLKVPTDINYYETVLRYIINKYSSVLNENECSISDLDDFKESEYAFITTNYRVIVENHWEEDLKFICNRTSFHDKRISVHFVCDIGVGREFTRHRVFSFAQESTRYCNFSKNKFNNELTFIVYPWSKDETIVCSQSDLKESESEWVDEDFFKVCEQAEKSYMNLIKLGWKPEQAREVLPLATKTELIITGFLKDWIHFFDLRYKGTTGKPHPQAKELAEPLFNEFVSRELI